MPRLLRSRIARKPHTPIGAGGSRQTIHPSTRPGHPHAYRRNKSAGIWSVLKANGDGSTWLQKFAKADDLEDANGSTVLSFFEACDLARKLARGEDTGEEIDAGKPTTVKMAIDQYERAI